MQAIVTGTPLQVEGEPAEIAQLVELLTSGAVLVEHVHRWRVEDADEGGVQEGRCWCGQTREFAPWASLQARKQSTAVLGLGVPEPEGAVNTVAVGRGSRKAKGGGRTAADRSAASKCPECGGHWRSKLHQDTCKAAA